MFTHDFDVLVAVDRTAATGDADDYGVDYRQFRLTADEYAAALFEDSLSLSEES